MTMMTPVTLEQVQTMIDQFAQQFGQMVNRSEEIKAWNAANATEANRAAHLLLASNGTDLTAAQLATINSMLSTVGGFADWANTPIASIGNLSPLDYFRTIQRTVR